MHVSVARGSEGVLCERYRYACVWDSGPGACVTVKRIKVNSRDKLVPLVRIPTRRPEIGFKLDFAYA